MVSQRESTATRPPKRWKHDTPKWKATTACFILFNIVFLAAGAVALYYSEGFLNPNSGLYQDETTAFQSFATGSLTVFASCFLVKGAFGVAVGAIVGVLDVTQRRLTVERLPQDTAFDVLLTFYLIALGVCMIAAAIAACFLTFLFHTSSNVPADCPGSFGFDEGRDQPNTGCAFDQAAYTVVRGAVGSNQLADIWNAIQSEFDCCGYWCSEDPGGNSSKDCAAVGANLWQMESCYTNLGSTTVVCRNMLIDAVATNVWIPMTVAWMAFGTTLCMVVFSCQMRKHVVETLSAWASKI